MNKAQGGRGGRQADRITTGHWRARPVVAGCCFHPSQPDCVPKGQCHHQAQGLRERQRQRQRGERVLSQRLIKSKSVKRQAAAG